MQAFRAMKGAVMGTYQTKVDRPSLHSVPGHEFTYSYSQPDAYHFCQDSVIFPYFVAQKMISKIDSHSRVLDVCAGCGVIGFELAFHLQKLERLDFLEIQDEFKPYFAKNLEITKRDPETFRFLSMNYSELMKDEFTGTYDLILANPPYFFPDDGKLSASVLRNRCRFFLDSDFETLLRSVTHALRPGGEAYLLVKAGTLHGRNSLRLGQLRLAGQAQVKIAADIRGTDVLLVEKL